MTVKVIFVLVFCSLGLIVLAPMIFIDKTKTNKVFFALTSGLLIGAIIICVLKLSGVYIP